MFARYAVFALKDDVAMAEAEALADRFAVLVKECKGLVSATFLMDDSGHEHGAFTVWETEADAEAATAILGPNLGETVRQIAKSPPAVQGFRVHQGKS